jgi:hypothetical protein
MPMFRLRRWSVSGGFFILAFLVLCGASKSWAPDKEGDKAVQEKWMVDRSLSLTPRAEPVPALKYRLFPLESERKAGNAVPIYLRLVHEQRDETRREWRDKPDMWNKLPLEQLPVQEANTFLENISYMLKQLELGARRQTAEWNYTLDAGDPIGIRLPDAQGMRVYGGILLLKARTEIARGYYAAAAHTLQTGFAVSRHVVEGPFLINGLIGIAIASQMTDALVDWVSRTDAPNLYWALTALPRPLIDMRKELELEQRLFEMQFPVLADLKRDRAPAEWDRALRQVRTELTRVLGVDKDFNKSPLAGRTLTDSADQSPELPEARKYLIERMQLPADRVQAMAPAQVLLWHMMGVNEEFRDDLYKGTYLPTAQSLAVVEVAVNRLKSVPDTEATRIPRFLLPAVLNVMMAGARMERRIEALRVIEALRLHAAAHDGQLPDKLADVTVVPVPNDPVTGHPFAYRSDKNSATLVGPTLSLPTIPEKMAVRNNGVRFYLTIKTK